MSSHAKAPTASPGRSNPAKSMGLRAVLLAALAAFLLVPAASASAANNFKLNIIGSGSGEVQSEVEGFEAWAGTPPIACSYTAPGPQTGTCENQMAELTDPPFSGSGGERGLPLVAEAAAGSVFDHWSVVQGSILAACGTESLCFPKTQAGGDVEVTAVFCASAEPSCSGVLTLYVNGPSGSGTVTSSPGTINCAAGEECEGEFAGTATLTATPAAGYVVAGWIGCKQSGGNPSVCTAEMNEDREVTAIFLKEGKDGKDGTNGKDGKPGTDGTDGTNGTNGTNGATGPAGPAGAAGPQGPPGPAGKVKVTCKMKGKTKVKCTVKTASSSSASRVNWRLMRAGNTVSHGKTSTARLQKVLNGLSDGNYVLRVKGQSAVRLSIR